MEFAEEHGAVGIITSFIGGYSQFKEKIDALPDSRRWNNALMYNPALWNKDLFVFNLSANENKRFEELYGDGSKPLVLYATADTRFYDGESYTVSGLIPGREKEEVFLYGHLYEYGANDNASGCAVLLELARILTEGIKLGVIERPRFGIRIMMGWEYYGSTAYFEANQNVGGRNIVGGIIADIVGAADDDAPETWVVLNPLSNCSVLDEEIKQINTLYKELFGYAGEFRYRPFDFSSDHIVADPSWGAPTVSIMTSPFPYHHNSADTPEKIDPKALRRNAAIVGSLACLGLDNSAASLIPVRTQRGCPTFTNRPEIENARYKVRWNVDLNLALFWVNGTRTLWEVAVNFSIEQGTPEKVYDNFAWIKDYFEFMCDNGYLKWKS